MPLPLFTFVWLASFVAVRRRPSAPLVATVVAFAFDLAWRILA